MMKRLVGIVFVFISFSMTGDLGSSEILPDVEKPDGWGSWFVTGHEWPHDGNPFESKHFVVFSDASSYSARKYLSEIGEKTYLILKTQLEISDDKILKFPKGQTKIHIYAYKTYFPKDWGGKAYYGGYMIYSPDHKERGKEGHTEPEIYSAVVRHELTHVIQNLILGRLDNTLVDVWLSEGLAEMVSQSNPERRIDSEKKMDELISKFGSFNPISMHRYDYPDIEGIVVEYYYPMFQLAVTYLTDQDGLDVGVSSIKNIFIDVYNGDSFSKSFEKNFGMSLIDYEENFFILMRDYLESDSEEYSRTQKHNSVSGNLVNR